MDLNGPPNKDSSGSSDFCNFHFSCAVQMQLSANRRRTDGKKVFGWNNCVTCGMHYQMPTSIAEQNGFASSPPAPLQSANWTIASGSMTAQVGEYGWQECGPSLTERTGYLVNNPRMSDVKFLVGESKVEMYAHKTLLALGSPVFEAQFFGSVASFVAASSVDVIELPDVEQETFFMFLKYLYTDEIKSSLDYTQLLCLLCPAKKYFVPHLLDKCLNILKNEINPENVFEILHHAQFYDFGNLAGCCERYIDRHTEAIVTSEEFVNIGRCMLTEFLKRDGLHINEVILFQAVLRWATAECRRNSVEASNENVRFALGDCLKLIRFPTMSKEEFSSVFETSNILSPDEACSVFMFMCNSPQNSFSPAPIFPTVKRKFAPQVCVVSRFSGEPQEHNLEYQNGEIYNCRLNFKVDRNIYLKGVNIFSIQCGPPVIYQGEVQRRHFHVSMYLYEKMEKSCIGHKLFNKQGALEPDVSTSSVNSAGTRRHYYPVLFDSDIPLGPEKTYTVCVVVFGNSHSNPRLRSTCHTCVGTGERKKSTVTHSHDLPVNFTFLGSSIESGQMTSAQIPELIFCI